MKRLLGIERDVQPHWVGDGFPVRSILSYHEQGAAISPFLLQEIREAIRDYQNGRMGRIDE